MMLRIYICAATFAAAGLLPAPALAGWVETDREGGKVLYSAGKIKEISDQDPTWTVLDIRTGHLLMVHSERRVFTRGTVADYCRTISEAISVSMAEMSPEERAMMEHFLGKDRPPGAAPAVRIEPAVDGGTIAGLATEKYLVLVDGRRYEELWLAPDAGVMQELNPADVRKLEKQMAVCMESLPGSAEQPLPESDPAYEGLLQKGWVMRSLTYSNGDLLSETEVASLQEWEIPASEFQPPPGYREVSLREFMAEE